MHYPKVAVILLNWNRWEDTIECLESLYCIDYPSYNVVVLDNGSKDGSLEKIRGYTRGRVEAKSDFAGYDPNNKPMKVLEYQKEEAENGGGREGELDGLPCNRCLILIDNGNNYGYAEGTNIGIRYASKALEPDYILLLNNDTFVDKGFLTELVKVTGGDESIGMVGPKVYYYDFKGRRDVIHSAGAVINMGRGTAPPIGVNEIDKGQYDEISQVDYLEGACILVKRDVIEKIGLLSSEYFAYWEETDLCIRAHMANYKIVYVPKSRIWHKVKPRFISSSGAYYITRNAFLFMKKYSTPYQFLSFLLYFSFFQFWLTLAAIIYCKNTQAILPLLKGVRDGVKMIYT